MPEDVMLRELKMLAKRSVFLNLAAYLVSVIVLGVTLSFALGLLLGTAVLIGTLLLMRYSLLRMAGEAKRTGVTSRRRWQLFYALRLLLFGAAFAAALLLRRYLSPVGVAVPMLYPRLIYTAGAVFHRRDSDSRMKKR
ncbi:MAG: ATP synthase subunit I [Oscillospiraceae bacterium]|nr:ATP synthase subunit I [Oscillospiraceae bacterium]